MVRLFKLSLLSLLVAGSVSANGDNPTLMTLNDLQEMDLSETTLQFGSGMVQGLEGNNLCYDQEGFYINAPEGTTRVHSYDTNKLLRGKNQAFMAKYAQIGKFKVSKFDNGEYSVETAGGLNGGGIAGATLGSMIGKGIVHFLGHGTILIVSACTGPAAPATFAGLEAACFPFIELASNVAAVGGGILVGVATGPV